MIAIVSAPVGSFLPPSERPFGKYELVAKLAMGGMAEIFLAREREGENKGKLMVIKRVLPHLTDESRFIAMFRDEARLASKLIHPNVCRVFDSGAVGHTYFMAMEYLHGVPLSRMLLRAARTKEPIPLDLVGGIIAQCCEGLDYAHNLTSSDGKPLDVVHRDISPPNIFVTVDGLAKILDFGVAKARGATQKTRTGTVKGKNSYMSPEQILGQDVDRRSDVFSLGIVLWEALSAKRLFSRDTDFLTFRAITESDIPDIREIRPDITEELAAVVKKSLERDRDKRYATAQEMADDIHFALDKNEGIASRERIAEDISTRFSKELKSKNRLTHDITDQLKALAGEGDEYEGFSIDTPAPAGKGKLAAGQAQGTAAVAVPRDMLGAASESAELPLGAGDSGEQMQPPKGTNTDIMAVHAPNEMRKWALLGGGGVLLLVLLVAFVFSGGEQTSASSAAADAGVTALASRPADAAPPDAAPLPDAALPVDAAPIPDAAPVETAPKVDRRPAYLTVDSHPYATIYVDGKKLGVTPIFKAKLKPGAHKLKAVSATGAKKSMKLVLKPGKTKNLGRLSWK